MSSWCEVYFSFWGDSETTATLAFFPPDKHTRQKTPPHNWHSSLGYLSCTPAFPIWTLSFFLPISRRRHCDVSIRIYYRLTITLCAQIPLFILFFWVFLKFVSSSWCRCCWCSAWRQRKPRPYKRWMITSEEALFPCVPEWARRKQEDEAKFK